MIVYANAGEQVVNGGPRALRVAATHSDIQGGYAGAGNIDADPLFVNAAAGDLHLKPGSPCLGVGTAMGAPATDKDGRARPDPPSIGAYELASAGATHVLWDNADGTASIWNYGTDTGGFSFHDYGPYPGWTAKAVADDASGGADGKTRVLWDNTDGTASIWSLDNGSGQFTFHDFGPYVGWTATAISAGP